MATDPSISLNIHQQPQMDFLGKLMQLEQMRGMQQQGQMNDLRIKEHQAEQVKAQQAQATQNAAKDAIAKLRDGQDVESIFTQLQPDARMLAEEWYGKFTANKRQRESLLMKDRKERAHLVRQFGYDPTVAEVMFGLDDDPQAQDLWQRLGGDAAALKQIVDGFADAGETPPNLTEHDPTKDLINPKTGVVMRPGVPKPVEEKTYPITVKGPNGTPVRKLFTAAELGQGIEEYKPPAAPKEHSRFWVMRGDQPVRITEAEYRPGDKPASNREQGRPVTSGDANRVADLDTSLNDLGVLRQTLTETKHATGTTAAIGASTPAWATDLFGWGTDAKKRQGVIDRVKQVIGKALEGGVLRKEDEYKYTKILPTIKDTPEVAASKLNGLESALIQRRSTTLDALSDAGYDISRFAARPPHTQPKTDGEGFTGGGMPSYQDYLKRKGVK
jgi:hypothetical protein